MGEVLETLFATQGKLKLLQSFDVGSCICGPKCPFVAVILGDIPDPLGFKAKQRVPASRNQMYTSA